MLSLIELHKEYDDAGRALPIIEALSYTFPERGSAAIVGRSGVGKSTLLHIIAGLDRKFSGRIEYDGRDIGRYSSDELSDFRANNIGFVFQFHHLLPEFTALENVTMPLSIRNQLDGRGRLRAECLLERVGLAKMSQRLPGELSGGEQQRVAVARALIGTPRYVLADEPTGNLDAHNAQEIQNVIKSLVDEEAGLLIVVTHSMEFARNLDLTLEMQAGGVLKEVSKIS